MIHRFDTVDSTNTRTMALGRQGAPHGTVVIAAHQTGGRGRLGRSFHSPPGTGLYMSMLLRPKAQPGELMHLTCAVAVAAQQALLEATGFSAGIKWINDLVAGSKKLGGILTELEFAGDRLSFAVVGIGINCNLPREQIPPALAEIATSVLIETGRRVDMALLEQHLINALLQTAARLICDRKQIMGRYGALCVTPGKAIRVVRGETDREATALSVAEDGALLVEYPDKTRELISSGEVSVRGMYGYV